MEKEPQYFAREKIPKATNGKRRCKFCGKLLSKYNQSRYCFLHQIKTFDDEVDRRKRNLRKARERYRTNKEVRERILRYGRKWRREHKSG